MAYKDSLFRSIFGNEKAALGLYNALHGTHYGKRDTEVVINTLNETLWTRRKNDLSFLINQSLVVVVEHQSTINDNLPFRFLQYVCRLFENSIADKKSIYRQNLIGFPRPRFIAFYNGTADFPDYKKLYLSTAFKRVSGFEEVNLELEVDVYNINDGRNQAILEASEELKGYAYFVSRVRWHEAADKQKGTIRDGITLEAIRKAVQDCKNAGLLKEFWENLSREEMNMLNEEWNWDDALAVRYEEGMEEGLERGMEEGLEKTARNALAKGLPLELIHDLTGLDMETITNLQADSPLP